MKENGLILGLVLAGLLGAAWIAMAATTGYGTAQLGLAFGLIAGLCIRLCSGGEHSPVWSLAAAVIAVIVVFASGYFAPNSRRSQTTVEEQLTDEAMVVSTATQLAERWAMEGGELPWPEGVDASTASKRSDFPPALWQAASRQWQSMPPRVKARCREARKANLQQTGTGSFAGRFGWVWGIAFPALAGIVAAATCVIGSE